MTRQPSTTHPQAAPVGPVRGGSAALGLPPLGVRAPRFDVALRWGQCWHVPRRAATAIAFVAAAACATRNYHLRVDGGYQAPVVGRHDGFLSGTVGVGVQARNALARVALTADLVARPAANGALLSLEANRLGLFARHRVRENVARGVTLDQTMGVALVTRLSAGPAFGSHAYLLEGALGVASYSADEIVDARPDYPHEGSYLSFVALEGFATRTSDSDHVDWMLGARITLTLPLNFLEPFVVDDGRFRTKKPTR